MSVTIHPNMVEAAALYEDGGELIMALLQYAEYGTEPDSSKDWYPCFVMGKPLVLQSKKNHENGSKGGRKGGYETPLQENAVVGSDSGDDKQNKINIKGKEKEDKGIAPRQASLAKSYAAFEPPTIDEVRVYAETNGLRDPDGFFAYYDAQGWVTAAGLPLTSWQSKLMAWSADERSKKPVKHASKYAGVA